MSDERVGSYGWDESMEISLHDKIKQDMKASMRSKENAVRDTMRLIMGEYPKLTVSMTLESGKKPPGSKQRKRLPMTSL